MRSNRKRIFILAVVLVIGYCGAYLSLRFTGIITRNENRGAEEGNEIKAKASEWYDLIPSLGKAESIAVNGINVIFYPLEWFEEIAHNLYSK